MNANGAFTSKYRFCGAVTLFLAVVVGAALAASTIAFPVAISCLIVFLFFAVLLIPMTSVRTLAVPARFQAILLLRNWKCQMTLQSLAVRLTVLTAMLLTAVPGQSQVTVTNLVTDDPTVHAATITDVNLQNAWGISSSTGSPFWVSSNAMGRATLYNVNPGTNVPSKAGLEVTIPGDGSVTGQTFSNIAGSFNGDAFLFVSEDGTISGWRGALGTTDETFQVADPANVYKGAALVSAGGNAYLYAANFRTGRIDVLKGNAAAPDLTGTFTDPNTPSGYAPFNIQNLGGKLYVTYAQQDLAKHDDVAGAGQGFVDAFDTNGNLLSRIATQGALNSPWGLTIAPSSFGSIAGDLLVGNFGDGTINAFNLASLAFDGPLKDAADAPIVIDGLWGLTIGNDGMGGSTGKVYFSEGPDGETHGLFGVLTVPEPSSIVLAALGLFAWIAWGWRWRTR
jgi:uncharacterized protein (TIGR03118 family)